MLKEVDRIVVENIRTGEALAVITDDEITTASDEIVVRLRPIYPESTSEQKANNEYNHAGNNCSKDSNAPIMRLALSLLSNPALFFGCLSGGLLAHFVLLPIILH